LITAVVAFAILGLQARGYRRFEAAIAGLLGVILLGFVYGHGQRAAGHGDPRRHGDAARDLPALALLIIALNLFLLAKTFAG
jgi:hypothetical protein